MESCCTKFLQLVRDINFPWLFLSLLFDFIIFLMRVKELIQCSESRKRQLITCFRTQTWKSQTFYFIFVNRRPRPHVSVFVSKRRLSSSVFKPTRVHTQRIRIVFARPNKNAKQWKNDGIFHRACVMIVVNDVLHHRIRKPPFSSVHTFSQKQLFQKVPLWRASSESAVFIGYVWTEAVSVQKKLRFQIKTGESFPRAESRPHHMR